MTKRKLDVANTSKKQKNNTDINLEEDVIKYHLMPSLQHVSMSNIIITLWNQADIKYQIVKLFNEYEYNFLTNIYKLFLKIEDKVLDQVLQLPVPDCIRKLLSNIVHPIGYEIFNWIEYQDRYIFNTDYRYQYSKSIAINYIDYLVWTARGVIDYKETAKTLLAKEEKLFDGNKYDIACSYCLEDDIAIIAPKVIDTTLSLRCIKRQAMVHFWTAHITGDFTKLYKAFSFYNRKYSTNYSINECLFKELIDNDCTNQVGIKYIWDKLSNEAKARQIVSAIKNTHNTDIRCFLLSQISKEQEKEVFKTYDATQILLGFLDDWLWGQYFLPTIHHIWDIISGCDYLSVLKGIVNKMEKNHEDTEKYNQYKSIFKELWQYAPKHLKEYVFEHNNGHSCHSIFSSLFCKENIDIIQSILRDANDIQKKKIIFSNYEVDICRFLITSNQWDLLEIFIDYTLFAREDVECCKQALIKKKRTRDSCTFYTK
ncbi:uncharacterized protein [Parasteatoda tepidariorum]|uniref:uncharacterized protein n=1 Tax=Parasteatoda tepidariorum TaxID=114398 RepID=UPI00077FB1FC|nr:uncharacterized protein LOC107446311 [Parasteatoda tepidariorum]XP_042898672.1 uncharacterized protein LOC107446311 [Parasteatoda tepidariorum]